MIEISQHQHGLNVRIGDFLTPDRRRRQIVKIPIAAQVKGIRAALNQRGKNQIQPPGKLFAPIVNAAVPAERDNHLHHPHIPCIISQNTQIVQLQGLIF